MQLGDWDSSRREGLPEKAAFGHRTSRALQPECFVRELMEGVFGHPERDLPPSEALSNRFLSLFANGMFTREQLIAYGVQHYQLVARFTKYLEYILLSAPTRTPDDWKVKAFIAENLYEEYGEQVRGDDHPALYRKFLLTAGIADVLKVDSPLSEDDLKEILEKYIVVFPEVEAFIRAHMDMAHNFHLGLGALGPGHEWAIPVMFLPLIEGLKRYQEARQQTLDISYFTAHVEADEKHGELLRKAILVNATSWSDQERIRSGARASLSLRAKFWQALYDGVLNTQDPSIQFRWRRVFSYL